MGIFAYIYNQGKKNQIPAKAELETAYNISVLYGKLYRIKSVCAFAGAAHWLFLP
jgi:hypothetical protein